MTVSFDYYAVRRDFPMLHQDMNGRPLVYFDNAVTSQKPRAVLDAMMHHDEHDHANVNRGVHALSVRATERFEASRRTIQGFINAPHAHECIFVRGTTEAINLVAQCYALPRFTVGDEILITQLEHHANIVPWQMVCEKTGAVLRVAPISSDGTVLIDAFEKLLSNRTKFVAISHASNALGTINPVKQMVDMAHACGAVVLIDGAQAVAHVPVDVQALGCDFYAFSSHKMYGPTGVGLLWGKEEYLNAMPPYHGGGDMIRYVTFERTEYAGLPHKFEAGTPAITSVIGLGAAVDYLATVKQQDCLLYEQALLDYATQSILSIKGFRIIGTAANKVPVISFVHECVHPHDIATILDSHGIAARSGHHCAMPLMDVLGVPATTRLSLSFYNTMDEIDRCMDALNQVNEVFA